ncbi:MAG: hypothetical protein JWM76_368 [Pseudonocardiales bacterium]|nr:hypothetical protein [Pseudonocardiales bacterium]
MHFETKRIALVWREHHLKKCLRTGSPPAGSISRADVGMNQPGPGHAVGAADPTIYVAPTKPQLVKTLGAVGLMLFFWFFLVQPTIDELRIPTAHIADPGGFVIESLPALTFPFPTSSDLRVEIQQPESPEPSSLSSYINIKTAEPIEGTANLVLTGPLFDAFQSCTGSAAVKTVDFSDLSPMDRDAATQAIESQHDVGANSSTRMSDLEAAAIATKLRFRLISAPFTKSVLGPSDVQYTASIQCGFSGAKAWTVAGASHIVAFPDVFYGRPNIPQTEGQTQTVGQADNWDPSTYVTVNNNADLTLSSSTGASQNSSDNSSTQWTFDANQSFNDGEHDEEESNFLSAIFTSQSRLQSKEFHTFVAGVAVAAIVGLIVPVTSGAYDFGVAYLVTRLAKRRAKPPTPPHSA